MRDNYGFQDRMIELVINEKKNTLFNVYFVWFYVCVCVRDREREREREGEKKMNSKIKKERKGERNMDTKNENVHNEWRMTKRAKIRRLMIEEMPNLKD